jgi:hypothetical protein
MCIDSQKHDCHVRQPFTETILTILDSATFLTNNKNNANIAINANTATSFQVQAVCGICEKFGARIWFLQYLRALFVVIVEIL